MIMIDYDDDDDDDDYDDADEEFNILVTFLVETVYS
jgi:hypothetical protein